MIVADTNLIASLWMPNQMDELAYSILEKDSEWISPVLWKSEFRSVLSLYLREEILDFPGALQVMEEAEELMKEKEFEVNSIQVMSLIADSACSSYDCEFVALADDFNIPLITFDNKILKEFPAIAVHPKEYATST